MDDETKPQVWLVLMVDEDRFGNRQVSIDCICSTEQIALSFCITTRHCLGPVPLDLRLPEMEIPWEGAYFPHKLPTAEEEHETNEL